MDLQQHGICIGARPWKESDRMLTLFCEDGRIYDVVARGACKPKYKLKFAVQLFSACDYFLCPSKAGYYILGGATFGALSFLGIASDPDAYAAACVVCETARKCVCEKDTRMYAEVLAALGELSSGEGVRPDLVCLKILLSALERSGYVNMQAVDPQSDCGKVIGASAGYVSSLDIEKAATRKLLVATGARFAKIFAKLNSLDMVTTE